MIDRRLRLEIADSIGGDMRRHADRFLRRHPGRSKSSLIGLPLHLGLNQIPGSRIRLKI